MSRLKIEAAVLSDIGLVRKRNEDNFFFNGKYSSDAQNEVLTADISAEKALFAVCDGMGGIDNGDVASLLSVEAFAGVCKSLTADQMHDEMKRGIISANEKICSQMKDGKNRMGSTLAAVALVDDKLCVANVGDSRVYALSDGKLEQLTVDHTETQVLVNSGLITLDEAQVHPHRNRLTQHLGLFPDEIVIEPYINDNIEPTVGAKYLICSDGLYSMVDNERIEEILSNGTSAQEQCQELIRTAVENGGKDNVTAIVFHIDEAQEQQTLENDTEANISEETEREDKVDFLKEICNSTDKKFFIIRYAVLVVVLAIVFTIGAVAMNKSIDKRVGPDGYLIPVSEIAEK